MKKLSLSVAARIIPAAFLLTGIVSLTLLLGSARLGIAQESAPTPFPTPIPVPTAIPNVVSGATFYSGQATISTDNCSVSGGLCQAAPACNNGAGPNPVNINATVTLCEQRYVSVDPATLVRTDVTGVLKVRGTGTGFQFGKTYVSLLYFNGNTATCSRFPAGVTPTLQNIPQADSDFASMHLGFWVVKPNGTATLTVDKQATFSGLSNYKTVSVREMQTPNTACFNCGLDPAPQLNALRACGALTVTSVSDCSLP